MFQGQLQCLSWSWLITTKKNNNNNDTHTYIRISPCVWQLPIHKYHNYCICRCLKRMTNNGQPIHTHRERQRQHSQTSIRLYFKRICVDLRVWIVCNSDNLISACIWLVQWWNETHISSRFYWNALCVCVYVIFVSVSRNREKKTKTKIKTKHK